MRDGHMPLSAPFSSRSRKPALVISSAVRHTPGLAACEQQQPVTYLASMQPFVSAHQPLPGIHGTLGCRSTNATGCSGGGPSLEAGCWLVSLGQAAQGSTKRRLASWIHWPNLFSFPLGACRTRLPRMPTLTLLLAPLHEASSACPAGLLSCCCPRRHTKRANPKACCSHHVAAHQ